MKKLKSSSSELKLGSNAVNKVPTTTIMYVPFVNIPLAALMLLSAKVDTLLGNLTSDSDEVKGDMSPEL
jgi:hypothetical protein